jgi:uncharacterized membrane protein YecN with MAPEG domain
MPPAETVPIVAFYAGLNGLILLWLAVNVGRVRARERVLMGDGGNLALIRAMRGQANFVEYVPYCLILMALMAAMGTPGWVLHLFGIALTAGRLAHGWHFVQADAPGWQRGIGTLLTMLVLIGGSVGLIGHALAGGL